MIRFPKIVVRVALAAALWAPSVPARADDAPGPAAPEWPAGVLLLLNTQGFDTLHALNEMASGVRRDLLIEKIASAGPEEFEAVADLLNEAGFLSADELVKLAARAEESLNRSTEDTVAGASGQDSLEPSPLSASGRPIK